VTTDRSLPIRGVCGDCHAPQEQREQDGDVADSDDVEQAEYEQAPSRGGVGAWPAAGLPSTAFIDVTDGSRQRDDGGERHPGQIGEHADAIGPADADLRRACTVRCGVADRGCEEPRQRDPRGK